MKRSAIAAALAFTAVSFADASDFKPNFDGPTFGYSAFFADLKNSTRVSPPADLTGSSSRPEALTELMVPGFPGRPSFARSGRRAPLDIDGMTAEFEFINAKLDSVYSHLKNKQAIYKFSYEALKAEYLARLRAAASPAEYRAAMRSFAKAFHDPHLSVSFPEDQYGPWNPPPAVTNAVTEDGVLITRITRLYGDKLEITGGLEQSLALAKNARALVVDIRGNGGGNDGYTRAYISKLVARAIPTGMVTIRISSETIARYGEMEEDPARPGFSVWYHSEIPPNTDTSFKGPIAVLIDGGCVSSCEGTAVMFKFSGAARLYGAHTMGSSGYPAEIPLPLSGGSIRIPTWIQIMPDGYPIEDHGIYPDVEVDKDADALAIALSDIRAGLGRGALKN